MNDNIATGNTLRSLSPRAVQPMLEQPDDAKEGMSGIIQRLVAKEKEVLQLNKEIASLKQSKGRLEDVSVFTGRFW